MLAASVPLSLVVLIFAGSALAAPVVVLDPGHGGTNYGAQNPESQVYEKRLTLILAQRTASYLQQWVPQMRVVLTRTRDEYLTLEQRVRRANAAGGDLFVSLHLNATEHRGRQGFETFLLSREASDQEAARLAARENRGAQRKGRAAVVQAILADLRQSAAHGESAELARNLQRALARARGAARDRGVRQAPFDVLMGLSMPAALVEAGFIDHPVEGTELAQVWAQEQIAIALAAGIVAQLRRDRGSLARAH
jgi:N-acetylmuramoyl-L-alanine amidase